MSTRIPTLLQKISELASQPERRTAIDMDLMMDYTRVLYADLLEWRSKLAATQQTQPLAAVKTPVIHDEPTLAELAEAMEKPVAKMSEPPSTADRTMSTVHNAKPAQDDIRALIGINDKYQIILELFANDKAAYEEALDYINQSNSERRALDWLREQLWITEERSEAAQAFFEIVARFFAGK